MMMKFVEIELHKEIWRLNQWRLLNSETYKCSFISFQTRFSSAEGRRDGLSLEIGHSFQQTDSFTTKGWRGNDASWPLNDLWATFPWV